MNRLQIVSNFSSSATTELPGRLPELVAYGSTLGKHENSDVALAGSLMLVIIASGNKYLADIVPPYDTGLQINILVLGDTASGKNVLKKIISKGRKVNEDFHMLAGASSDSALHEALANIEGCAACLHLDEWPTWITKNDQHLGPLIGLMLELYSSARDQVHGKAQRKGNSLPPLDAPFFNLIGSAQPKRFADIVTEEMMSTGFLNRHLIIPVGEGRKRTFDERRKLKEEQADFSKYGQALLTINQGALRGAAPDTPHTPEELAALEVEYTTILGVDELEEKAEGWEHFFDQKSKGALGELWGRGLETAIKISCALALFDAGMYAAENNRRLYEADIRVTVRQFEWAVRLVINSIRTIERLAGDRLQDDPFFGRIKSVIKNYIEKNEGAVTWMPGGQLLNDSRPKDASGKYPLSTPELEARVQGYVDSGLLDYATTNPETGRGNSKRGYYRLAGPALLNT